MKSIFFSMALLVVACGSDKPPPLTDDMSSGTGGTSIALGGSAGRPTGTGGKENGPDASMNGGTGGTGGTQTGGAGGGTSSGGNATGGGGSMNGGPTVNITSPAAVDDPNAGPVLVEDGKTVSNGKVTVICNVSPSDPDHPVNGASVDIGMADAKGVQQTPVDNTHLSGAAGDYAATFDLTPVANGKVTFSCAATDDSQPPDKSTTQIATFVDHGPTIQVASPKSGSAHALNDALDVDFSVTPAPLDASDPGAAVDTVALSINGQDISLAGAADSTTPGHYRTSVVLGAGGPFAQPPSGTIPLQVSATNKRGPTAATATTSFNFVIDGTGPTITGISPVSSTVVTGQVPISFTVTDDLSGVNPATVTIMDPGATNGTFTYSPTDGAWTHSGNTYTFRLDTATIADSTTIQINLDFSASDLAGNASSGTSVTYYIDSQPPVIDLDPPQIRERKKEGQTFYCSDSFDPLGVAVSDLDVIPQDFVTFRALVFEQTNSGSGQTVVHPAGVDTNSVRLYVQPDTTQPLLVRSEGGSGACDEINGFDTLTFLKLVAIPISGSATYSKKDPPITDVCDTTDETPPSPLCEHEASDLTVAIAQPLEVPQPAVYATGDLSGVLCTGDQTQLSSLVSTSGWVCLAARVTDLVKNVGVSAPLRICLSPDGGGCTSPPPSCVDPACTPPQHFGLPIIDVIN